MKQLLQRSGGLAAMVLLVLAFAMWSTWLAVDVRHLRTRIETQVGWLLALTEARDALSEGHAPPDDIPAVLTEMEGQFGAEPAVLEALSVVRRGVRAGDPEAASTISAGLLPRIRRANGAVSRQLGSRWDQVTVLVFLSLLFALISLVLVVLRQRSEQQLSDAESRRRATEDRLAKVGVGLLGLDDHDEVVFANEVAHELARPVGGVSTWWHELVSNAALPGRRPCPVCQEPARVGRVVIEDVGGPSLRMVEVVFGGHAHDLVDEGAYEVVLVRDATAQRRQEARNLLESKLSSLDDLAGGVVHQLNSPMQVVIGSLQLARRDASGEVAELVDEALEGARRVVDVVTGLQVLRSSPEAAAVSLGEVCAAVERLVLPLCHGAVRLRCSVDPELRLRADPARLTAVLHELVRDAVLAVQAGGADPQVHVVGFVRDGRVVLEVRDRRPSDARGPDLRRALAEEVVTDLGGELRFLEDHGEVVARVSFPQTP